MPEITKFHNLPGGLGRLPVADPADENFPLSLRMRKLVPVVESHAWPIFASVLDQGQTPHCVGFGWTNFILCAPLVHTIKQFGDAEAYAHALYKDAQEVDEWPGNDYDGTSVRAGVKVLNKRGVVGEYRWTSDANDARDFILTSGPLVIGVNWYETMFNTDHNGFLNIGGRVEGGHCIVVPAFDNRRDAFRILNQWGRSWGEHGRAWVRRGDMQRLLDEEGECCASFETKLPKA